ATKRRKRKVKHMKKKVIKKKKQPKPKKDDEGQKRKLSPGTKKEHELLKLYQQVTLTVGSIKHRMIETGAASQPTGVSQTEAVTLANLLRWTVERLNLLQMHAYELIALDIENLIGPGQIPAQSSSSTQKRQKSDLDHLLDASFYHTLGTLLCSGQLGRNHKYQAALRKAGTDVNKIRQVKVPHVVQAYRRYVQASGFVHFNQPGGRSTGY
ncbi:hypothetical protein BGZ98_006236, partial [Dissophora globulifera]